MEWAVPAAAKYRASSASAVEASDVLPCAGIQQRLLRQYLYFCTSTSKASKVRTEAHLLHLKGVQCDCQRLLEGPEDSEHLSEQRRRPALPKQTAPPLCVRVSSYYCCYNAMYVSSNYRASAWTLLPTALRIYIYLYISINVYTNTHTHSRIYVYIHVCVCVYCNVYIIYT